MQCKFHRLVLLAVQRLNHLFWNNVKVQGENKIYKHHTPQHVSRRGMIGTCNSFVAIYSCFILVSVPLKSYRG